MAVYPNSQPAVLASVAEMQPNQSDFMITNTAAYTIVAIAYLLFVVATWSMFTM